MSGQSRRTGVCSSFDARRQYRLPHRKVVNGGTAVVESMDGGGWEAAVKASLLVALVFIIGFAHLSSHKQSQQRPLVHFSDPRRVGGALAKTSTDVIYALANSPVLTGCSVLLSDEALKQTCPGLTLSCEQHFAEYRATAGVFNLINDIDTQASALPSRPPVTSCTDSVSINSSTIEMDAPVSVCS